MGAGCYVNLLTYERKHGDQKKYDYGGATEGGSEANPSWLFPKSNTV